MASLSEMSQGQTDVREKVYRHSGWLMPLAVFLVITILSGLLLVYYLAPSPRALIESRPSPTSSTVPVQVDIGRLRLTVPSNYIPYRGARRPGPHKELALITALPDFRGYSAAEAALFADHGEKSPLVQIILREEKVNLPVGERLTRIYLSYVEDTQGRPGPFGLTQYSFRDDNGYRGEDLFVAPRIGGATVIRCWRRAPDNPSPDCLRDERLTGHVDISYRFKRANLGQWQGIANGVNRLIAGFEQGGERAR